MAEDFRVDTRFWLYHKQVEVDGQPVEVYGMGRFRVRPRRLGVGTFLVHAMEMIAAHDGKSGIVAFCDDSLLDFYIRKCGWFHHGKRRTLNIIASKPFQNLVVIEEW